jgi:bacterioferritin-associated ferredoxin
VSDQEIRCAVRDGAAGCAGVARECGAAGDCGGCLRIVEQIIHQELQSDSGPDPSVALSTLATASR